MTDAAPARTLLLPFDQGLLAPPEPGHPWLFLNAVPLADEVYWRERVEAVQGFRPDYLSLDRRGFSVGPVIRGTAFRGALILLGRHRRQNEGWFADALERVVPGGPIVVCGGKTDGVDSFRKWAERTAAVDGRMSKYHAVVFWLTRPADLAAETTATLRPSGGLVDGRFGTAPGMFSHAAIDRGSALLARHLEPRVKGRIADFGAGWGYLSAECLRACGGITRLDLYEADFESLEAARRNLAGMGDIPLGFHWLDLAGERITERYDTIVMNPPFHTGREAAPALGLAFIKAAHTALDPHGTLVMVANRQLPYEAVLNASFRAVRLLEEAEGYKVIEARK